MKNTKNEVVINARQVISGLTIIGLVVCVMATVGMMLYGIYTGDSRLIGEVSLFACVQTGYWSYTALEKNKKEKEAKKNEVVA